MLPELMQGLFDIRQTHYNLRNPHLLAIPSINSVYHGWESGPRIWNLASGRLKEFDSISSFKKEIKRWLPEICPCRLCKSYITI